MSRIAMLLSNAFIPDPRVAREAQALVRAGHQVTIVCWDREGTLPASETVDGYRVERVQSVPTVHGLGARQALYIPRFWLAAIRKVHAFEPDVIHCHDLDTLPAGWWLKGRTGEKLAYDAHEYSVDSLAVKHWILLVGRASRCGLRQSGSRRSWPVRTQSYCRSASDRLGNIEFPAERPAIACPRRWSRCRADRGPAAGAGPAGLWLKSAGEIRWP
jgi:glycosyltransferase involved in cell wall biosynthesis